MKKITITIDSTGQITSHELLKSAAERNGISVSLARRALLNGKIAGALRVGDGTAATWLVPITWTYTRTKHIES